MTLAEHLRTQTARYLQAVLTEHHGCISAAAREAGLCRPHLYKLLKRHGVGVAEIRQLSRDSPCHAPPP